MSRNDGYTTVNVLDYFYQNKYYRLIGTDLSRQTNTTTPRQFNFIRNLEDDSATIFVCR